MPEDEIQRRPDFLELANTSSALHPRDSKEERLLDCSGSHERGGSSWNEEIMDHGAK